MLTLLISLLFVGTLVAAGFGICKACSLIATHVQEHPTAGKALYEHVFLPLFARRDRLRQGTLEVIDVDERPEELAGNEKPSNAA
jgi:hypothetical protein